MYGLTFSPHLVALLKHADQAVLLFLNSFELLPHPLLVHLVNGLCGNPIIRNLPIFSLFLLLWYKSPAERRAHMEAGLLASCVAVMLAVRMQCRCFFHIRPLLNPHLRIHVLNPQSLQGWDRQGSFPSDTITFFAAMAMVLYLENRRYGLLAYFWVFVLAVIKVVTGFHYPSDVLAAMVLGSVAVLLANRIKIIPKMLERATIRLPKPLTDVAVMFFLMEAYTLFAGLQGVLHFLKNL